jgi:hypothetical protein
VTVDWCCPDAVDAFRFVNQTLIDLGLATASIGDRAIRMCDSCRGNRPASRRCLGWALELRDSTILHLGPLEEPKGRLVRIEVGGFFDFRRASPGGWVDSPLKSSSASVRVIDASDDTPIVRHHVDLAAVGQPGPVWHYQAADLGGGRLDVPRLPCAPLELMLLVELLLYNFAWEDWNSLRGTNPWRDWIKRSEALILPSWQVRLELYKTLGESIDSWLAAQCNVIGEWNPRSA